LLTPTPAELTIASATKRTRELAIAGGCIVAFAQVANGRRR
jgi:hypothetical protein